MEPGRGREPDPGAGRGGGRLPARASGVWLYGRAVFGPHASVVADHPTVALRGGRAGGSRTGGHRRVAARPRRHRDRPAAPGAGPRRALGRPRAGRRGRRGRRSWRVVQLRSATGDPAGLAAAGAGAVADGAGAAGRGGAGPGRGPDRRPRRPQGTRRPRPRGAAPGPPAHRLAAARRGAGRDRAADLRRDRRRRGRARPARDQVEQAIGADAGADASPRYGRPALLQTVRTVDPDGAYAMAVVAVDPGPAGKRVLAVDATRLATASVWPPRGRLSAAAAARALRPDLGRAHAREGRVDCHRRRRGTDHPQRGDVAAPAGHGGAARRWPHPHVRSRPAAPRTRPPTRPTSGAPPGAGWSG